jgi:hypothetical protein
MRCVLAALLLASSGALACEVPDEGNLPLRRAVARVQMLPEAQEWADEVRSAGAIARYALLLERTVRVKGRCYWTVELSADGKLWRRFYVSPDGKRALAEGGR